MLKWIVTASFALVAATSAAQAVGGSYRNTCDNVRQRGPYLIADCETADGDTRRTSIDVRQCGGDVANINGRLTCDRGRGGFDRGYRRGGRGYGEDDGGPRRRYRAPDRYQDDEN